MHHLRLQISTILLCVIVFVVHQMAGGQPTHLDTLRHFDVQPLGSYSAIWGYTAPDGREYAILGVNGSSSVPYPGGTSIIDITDINNVHEVAFIGGPNSSWREMKTYGHYAYVVTEAGGGTQIIDLSQLPDTATLVSSFTHTNGAKNTSRAHSISLHDGFMYLNGCANWGTQSQRGSVIFDLRTTPTSPQYAGEYSPNYFHDVYVLRDTLYGSSIYSSGGIYIADVTNKASIQPIGKISYTGSGTHNAWVTKDRQYVISTDEIGTSGFTLKCWNIGSLPTIPASPAATFTATPADIEHNITIRGDYAYVAWYTAGVRVVDVSNPAAPADAGGYDTSTQPSGGYNGAWGVYPYFPSGKIIAGDMQNGLWVFSFSDLAARVPVSLVAPLDANAASCLEFKWTSTASQAKDPHRYLLTVTGPGVALNVDVTDTSYIADTSGFQVGQTYQWSVTVKDEFNVTASQDTFSFQYVPSIPAIPSVVAPLNGAIGEPLTLSVTWDIVICASSYRLQVATDSLFAALVVDDSTLTGTSKAIGPLSYNTQYFWRVSAINALGTSGFSTAREFTTTIAPPISPVLLSPADATVDEPVNLDLMWSSSPTATTYHVQVATDSLFGSLVLNDSTLADTTLSVGPLAHLTQYFWRVRAKNVGGSSSFTTQRSFTTTIAPPAIPSLVQPPDNASGLGEVLLLQWNLADAGQSYRVQLATDSVFASLIMDDSTVVDTSKQTDSLEIGTSYYWRVRSKNTSGESPWSPVWKFTITFMVTRQYSVAGGWNLISVPLVVNDFSKVNLFPDAISNAFIFIPMTGYVQEDTLRNNSGYWLKYGSASDVDMVGDIRPGDSVSVEAGWNLIGSLSDPFPADSIASVPPGIVLSDFFGYNIGYTSADTLLPFAGYWVKVSESGLLILRSNEGVFKAHTNPPQLKRERSILPRSPRTIR